MGIVPGAGGLVSSYKALAPVLRSILEELELEVRPGRTTRDLDQIAADAILRRGVQSCFRGFRDYPAFITASVNHEVLNTLPSARPLREGDLFKVQVGIRDGAGISYQAWTYFVGKARAEDLKFVECGRTALARAVLQIRSGRRVVDVSGVIQDTLEAGGYSANREYVGHGMGVSQHEPPMIPCFRMEPPPESGVLSAGKILSLQVIAHSGRHGCRTIPDGWGVVTVDGSRALLFSQIVVVREAGAEEILEPRPPYPGV